MWGQLFQEFTKSALIVGAVAWLLRTVIDRWLDGRLEHFKADLDAKRSKQEEEIRHTFAVEQERLRLALASSASGEERIRREVLRWANPILDCVRMLNRRLRNILDADGFRALTRGFRYPEWSITYEYYLPSTMYAFASYFAWNRLLVESLSFELFRTQEEKDVFFMKLERVGSALGTWPPSYSCNGGDVQLFSMQQRAIGEAMIVGQGAERTCMSYAQFLAQHEAEPLRSYLDPLRCLIDRLDPAEDCRWKRMQATQYALLELEQLCVRLLNVPPSRLQQ